LNLHEKTFVVETLLTECRKLLLASVPFLKSRRQELQRKNALL
jgi:hypothetical protein